MDRSMAHRRRKNACINALRLNPGGAISVIDVCSAVFCVMSAFGAERIQHAASQRVILAEQQVKQKKSQA
jgi:hypothetical protein